MTKSYKISNLSTAGTNFTATITFNPAHPVFAGHFPGQPIVPGVVLVEASAAIVSRITGKELIVKEASVIKFLHVIDPVQCPQVIIDGSIVEEEAWYKADMTFSLAETIYLKIKGLRLAQQ